MAIPLTSMTAIPMAMAISTIRPHCNDYDDYSSDGDTIEVVIATTAIPMAMAAMATMTRLTVMMAVIVPG